jgi:hypothetical protein
MTAQELPEMIAPDLDDPRIQAALIELRALITQRFPNASFSVFRGEDPEGIRLLTTADVDDLDEVMDAVIDRMVDMQIYEGLPVYVVPVWPPARTHAFFARHAGSPLAGRHAVGGH